MKEQVNLYDFERRFKDMDRDNNFSYDGKKALFEYLEQLEEDCGEEIELDVIALCCEYTEYEGVEEFIKEYQPDIDKKDYEDEEEFKEALEEFLQDRTTLIKLSDDLDDGFIIQCY